LLDLDTLSGSEPPIAEAVALLSDLLGAQLGHVELFPPRGDAIVFEHAHGREGVAREIIQSAVETRTTINIQATREVLFKRLIPNNACTLISE
jgi:hypothetical protein